jgi:hypothetical protein
MRGGKKPLSVASICNLAEEFTVDVPIPTCACVNEAKLINKVIMKKDRKSVIDKWI